MDKYYTYCKYNMNRNVKLFSLSAPLSRLCFFFSVGLLVDPRKVAKEFLRKIWNMGFVGDKVKVKVNVDLYIASS